MRKFFIAGNWKMNLSRETATALVQHLIEATQKSASESANVDIAVCPPNVYLDLVSQAARGTQIKVGAQNTHAAADGAYTGEVSCEMLKDVGSEYVILGHSERRTLFGETDCVVNEKLKSVLKSGIKPIVCIGETLEQREAGETQSVVRTQCEGSLKGLSSEEMTKTVLAYEPVWAIGTGKTATPAQAEEVHADIRALLTKLFGEDVAQKVVIQYGGSVKADNAEELLSQPNIDGALVGGASLKSDSFLAIVKAAAGIKK